MSGRRARRVRRGRRTPGGRPLLGLGYLVALALLVAASIGAYNKDLPWQSTVPVSLTTTTPGLELNPLSDVKFQGVRVGEVRKVTSDGRSARVELAIDPDRIGLIPANVDAAIVPKTLFGEKYVDLRARGGQATAARLAAHDVITQSRTSVEIGQLYSKLVPLLRTLRPDQLSVTLSNLAQAVDGRGASIARVLNQLDELLGRLEPHLGTATDDLRKLARVSDVYAASAGDLMGVLDNSAAISEDLLVAKEKSFAQFLDVTGSTSDELGEVLAENATTMIRLAGRSRPVLALLHEYSAALPCLVQGLEVADRAGQNAAGARGPYANLGIDMFVTRAPYTADKDLPTQDNDANDRNLPSWAPSWRPHCAVAAPWILNLKNRTPYSQPGQGTAITPHAGGSTPAAPAAAPAPAGATAEALRALGRSLAAQRLGVQQDQVPPYAEMLMAPLLADGQVEVR